MGKMCLQNCASVESNWKRFMNTNYTKKDSPAPVEKSPMVSLPYTTGELYQTLLRSIKMAQSLAFRNAFAEINKGIVKRSEMAKTISHLRKALAAAQELNSRMAGDLPPK